MEDLRPSHWPTFLAALAILFLVSTVFWPILGFEFVQYDVSRQLLRDSRVQHLTLENVKDFFTTRCITSYYPVRTLTFAMDHKMWGLNPGGFKLTNGLIHLANSLLLLWLVLRLFRHPACVAVSPGRRWDLSVAAFAAGVFAIHPVVVEPVAWVGGREELLMTLGTLGCIHFHLTARCLYEKGSRTLAVLSFAGAGFCCAAACLSNVVAAVIPLLIVTWDLLTLTRAKWRRIVYGSFALWMIGAATILIKISGPERQLVAAGPGMFSVERAILVLNVYWLNLKTLAWPTKLGVHYSTVKPESFLDAEVIFGGIAMGLTCVVLWRLRRRKFVLFGLLWLGLAMAPASQIVLHHISRADRFLYLPLVGLAVAVAMGLRPLGNRLKGRGVLAAIVPGVLALLLLNVTSAWQVQTWRDDVSVWPNCLRVDPKNAMGYFGMADALADRARFREAIDFYYAALSLDPDATETLKYFALLLATCPDEQFRDYDRAIRLASRACEVMDPPDPAAVMILAEVHAQAGQLETAIDISEKAMAFAWAAGNTKLSNEFRERQVLYRDRFAEGRTP